MRVLVIGASGFAGHHLTRELLNQGHEVWGTTRRERSGGESPRWVVCDVTSADSVRKALEAANPDGVVLLAGLAAPPLANREPAAAFEVHAVGATHVLEEVARREASPRLLVVTSSEVYGSVEADELPITEEAPLRPTSLYAASKAAADLAARAFSLTRDCDVVRVRPFNHTGPGQRTDFVCADFASQVAAIAAKRRPPRMEVGNLDVSRDFSDVRDIVRGYVSALERGGSGEVYNLCAERAISVRSILADLCEMAGVRPEVESAAHRRRRAEVPVYWGSAAKAARELGWRAEIPWRQTLADLLTWARERLDA